MKVDRFWGEAVQPRLLYYCEYCGGGIYELDGYYEYEGLRICDECTDRFSWAVFEERAVRKTAKKDILL